RSQSTLQVGPRVFAVLRFNFLHRVRGRVARYNDFHSVVFIAIAGVFTLHTFSGQAKRLPALRAGRNPRLHWTAYRRNVDLRSAYRLADGDRQVDVDVIAATLEKRMRPHVHEHVEVAGRRTGASR